MSFCSSGVCAQSYSGAFLIFDLVFSQTWKKHGIVGFFQDFSPVSGRHYNLILTLCIKIPTSFWPDQYLVSACCAKIAHSFWPSHCFVTAPVYDNQSFVMVPPLFRYGPVYKKCTFVTARSLFRYGPRRTKTASSLRPGEFGP